MLSSLHEVPKDSERDSSFKETVCVLLLMMVCFDFVYLIEVFIIEFLLLFFNSAKTWQCCMATTIRTHRSDTCSNPLWLPVLWSHDL